MIWNNLLEPAGAKSAWTPLQRLRCPTKDSPYLATDKNSDGSSTRADKSNNNLFERVGSNAGIRGHGSADWTPGTDFMKLEFGRKVFGQIFTIEFWANFHPKTAEMCI
jgi:hypothetical protein